MTNATVMAAFVSRNSEDRTKRYDEEPGSFRNVQAIPTTCRLSEVIMGRGILLWLLGVPLPIVILLVLFMR